jgi:hypothetical protein
MNKQQSGWLLLFMLALFLIIIGFQGNLGTTIAILFSPTQVQIGNEGTLVNGVPSGA